MSLVWHVRNNGVPTALCALRKIIIHRRVRGVVTGQGKTNDGSGRNHLLTAVD